MPLAWTLLPSPTSMPNKHHVHLTPALVTTRHFMRPVMPQAQQKIILGRKQFSVQPVSRSGSANGSEIPRLALGGCQTIRNRGNWKGNKTFLFLVAVRHDSSPGVYRSRASELWENALYENVNISSDILRFT